MTAGPSRRRLCTAAVVAAVALTGGCSSILPGGDQERPATYRITTPEIPPAGVHAGGALVIGEPTAAPGLDTDRIAVWQTPQRLEYYEGARWVEEPPGMVRAALLDAFRASGALTAVGRRSIDLNPDWRLDSRLSAFEAGYRGDARLPTIEVTLDASLLREPSQQVAATRSFTAEVRPAGTAVPEVVAAYDEATHQVVRQVVDWSLGLMAAGS